MDGNVVAVFLWIGDYGFMPRRAEASRLRSVMGRRSVIDLSPLLVAEQFAHPLG